MGKLKVENLAKEFCLDTPIEFFEYMIDTYIQKKYSLLEYLYAEMRVDDQKDFLDYLQHSEYCNEITELLV